jgi:hypothetical protein
VYSGQSAVSAATDPTVTKDTEERNIIPSGQDRYCLFTFPDQRRRINKRSMCDCRRGFDWRVDLLTT